MARKQYVVCRKCGKQDTPDTSVVPHNVGTATVMKCRDCADGRYLNHPQGTQYATMCRACCPTGHGTRFEPKDYGKCGECLMNAVEIVQIGSDGICPRCGANYGGK